MVRSNRKLLAAAVAVAVVAVAAGCSSGSSSSTPPTGGSTSAAAPTKTLTIGLLYDATGLAASSSKTALQGVQAGIQAVAPQGYKFKLVTADTQTNPASVLTAAQKLVQRDHVFAVIAHSALFYAAAHYLTMHNIPVVGAAEDGPEWITSKNMFGVFGAVHTGIVTTTFAQFMKNHGVTTVGALGYSISPTSAQAAKGMGVAATSVGMKVGYINANFPFGSTNVQPDAIAMKSAGVNGVYPTTDPNTGFALISALRNLNADVKVALLPTGYGGDLLQAGPGALKQAQNVFFGLQYEPVEMNTPATQRFVAALAKVGVTTIPTYAMYNGYASMFLLVQGLQAAGANPTQASLINGLSTIHAFTADGLFGSHSIDINNRTDTFNGADGCTWITQLTGTAFKLVAGADPICGHIVPGKTVSP